MTHPIRYSSDFHSNLNIRKIVLFECIRIEVVENSYHSNIRWHHSSAGIAASLLGTLALGTSQWAGVMFYRTPCIKHRYLYGMYRNRKCFCASLLFFQVSKLALNRSLPRPWGREESQLDQRLIVRQAKERQRQLPWMSIAHKINRKRENSG